MSWCPALADFREKLHLNDRIQLKFKQMFLCIWTAFAHSIVGNIFCRKKCDSFDGSSDEITRWDESSLVFMLKVIHMFYGQLTRLLQLNGKICMYLIWVIEKQPVSKNIKYDNKIYIFNLKSCFLTQKHLSTCLFIHKFVRILRGKMYTQWSI